MATLTFELENRNEEWSGNIIINGITKSLGPFDLERDLRSAMIDHALGRNFTVSQIQNAWEDFKIINQELIMRENIDELLDNYKIQYRSPHNARWYNIRRNGQTKRWKRDKLRISIPCKIGFRECFTITERDFNYPIKAKISDGKTIVSQNSLNPREYRTISI